MANDVQWDVDAWMADAMQSQEMKNLLENLARDAIRDTEPFTPVDTGKLKASWLRLVSEKRSNPYMHGDVTWTVSIYNPTLYASYQEFGTRYMAGRKMLHAGTAMNSIIWPKDQEPYVPPRVLSRRRVNGVARGGNGRRGSRVMVQRQTSALNNRRRRR